MGQVRGGAQRHHRKLPGAEKPPDGPGGGVRLGYGHRGGGPAAGILLYRGCAGGHPEGDRPGRGQLCPGHPLRGLPGKAVRRAQGQPLIIGVGQGENFIASDVPAILSYTRDIYRLKDREIAVLTRESIAFYNQELDPIQKESERIQWDIDAAEKGGYEHFMMKEIYEQPEALRKTISPASGRERSSWMTSPSPGSRSRTSARCASCLRHGLPCGVVAKYAFERLLKIPLEVDVASEFAIGNPF